MHRRKNVRRIQILMNRYCYPGGIRSPASALRNPLFLEYLPYDIRYCFKLLSEWKVLNITTKISGKPARNLGS